MKLYPVILLIFLSLTTSAYAGTFRISLAGAVASKKLTGTDPISGDEGVLISNGNFNTGFNLSYSFDPHWHVLLGMENRSYDFDNSDNIISGPTKLDLSATQYGIRWIMFAKTAFRFLYTAQDEAAFIVTDSNQAELYKESISFFTIYWDQLIYSGENILIGFKVGYDVAADATEIV